MEVYIDDIVVKSQDFDKHLENLEKVFIRMRKHQLKMNPLKCAFGVMAGIFLGFLVLFLFFFWNKNSRKGF